MRQYLTPETGNILRSGKAPQVRGFPENADMLGIGSICLLSIRTQRNLMDLLQVSIFWNLQVPNGWSGKNPGARRPVLIHGELNDLKIKRFIISNKVYYKYIYFSILVLK